MTGKIEGLKVNNSFSIFNYLRVGDEVKVTRLGHIDLARNMMGDEKGRLDAKQLGMMILRKDPLAGAGKLLKMDEGKGEYVLYYYRSDTLDIPGEKFKIDPENLEEIKRRDEQALKEKFPDEIFVRGKVFY